MKVYLGFTAGKGVTDRAIAFVERTLEHDDDTAPSPLATHVYFTFSMNNSRDIGIEAVPPRVRTFDATLDRRPEDRHYLIACNRYQAQLAYDIARMHVGRMYDFAGLAVVLGYCATGFRDRFYKNEHASVFCSELVIDVLRGAGIEICGNVPSYDFTPSRLETNINMNYKRV